MAEDEEGYRKLLDKKKDKRLAFLLSQTDDYINQLTDMVGQHKMETTRKLRVMRAQKQEKKAIIPEHELRFNVNNNSTGLVLEGHDAPLASELKSFLEKNSDPFPRVDSDKQYDEEGTAPNKEEEKTRSWKE